MKKKRSPQVHWVRLDNAAKIYPAAMRKNWSNVFRQSVTLTEPVDKEVLQSALHVTVGRFPSIAARLRKGVFWYYLQQVDHAPAIREEYSYPLTFMSKKELRQCAFRVIAYQNRIAIEFFHSLTDGTGAMVFLKNLTAEYLEQKYNISISHQNGVVDRKAQPEKEELEDCFHKYAGSVPASRKDTDAWHMTGESLTDGFLNLTCFRLPVEQVLQMAHAHGVSMTVFMSAVMMQSLLNMQKEKNSVQKRQKRIKLLIPVNLRGLFPSKTLRNFALYTIPELDPRLGEYTFDEICQVIFHKIGTEATAKYMSSMIATNVNDEKNPLLRLVPLPLKNMVMKAVFDRVGEKKSCLSMSNMGRITLPKEMEPYVTRFDFILGTQADAPYNCGLVTYGDQLYLNFTRNTKVGELEYHFHKVLQELGLTALVESNQR